jgi:hypothetical protein
MQLKINDYNDSIIEWIPFNQFIDIEKIGNDDDNTAIIYLAKWKDGPLKYDSDKNLYKRKNYENVILKYLNNSQNIIYEFFNEV